MTGPDYYVPTSSDSYSDEMSATSSPYQTPWNPVITAPTKISPALNSIPEKVLPMAKPSSSSPASACWDWLLYPPEIYSHLYIPSSSFLQPQVQEDEWNLLTSLPTWLLALLYPSMKNSICPMDDENESDQEISSLRNHDEKKLPSVSSTLPLSSSEKPLHDQINRSSTPDTDDGYQSASDASRSDYSQQSSLHYDHSRKDVPSTLTPKRISYAAAVKPLVPMMNQKIYSAPTTPINKMKNSSSCLSNNDSSMSIPNGQKSKFIAPRFERMHHAKQYSSSTTTTTTAKKDSSPLISNNRGLSRSNNNPNQRHYLINTSRRR